jgi:hypothetical protein
LWFERFRSQLYYCRPKLLFFLKIVAKGDDQQAKHAKEKWFNYKDYLQSKAVENEAFT